MMLLKSTTCMCHAGCAVHIVQAKHKAEESSMQCGRHVDHAMHNNNKNKNNNKRKNKKNNKMNYTNDKYNNENNSNNNNLVRSQSDKVCFGHPCKV